VHDYIKEYGGAERVLEALHEIYPDATVFTSVYLPSYLGPHRARFAGWKIKTTFLQWLPFKAKLISPMRLLAPLAFKQLNFDGYCFCHRILFSKSDKHPFGKLRARKESFADLLLPYAAKISLWLCNSQGMEKTLVVPPPGGNCKSLFKND